MSEEDDLDFTVGWALNALAEYGEDTQENIEKVYRAGDNYISKDKLREIVRWIIVIEDPRSNNYRPIKNTSAQDVYEAFYKIKKLVKE